MAASVSRLLLYPVKGCRGIAVEAADLLATGLSVDGVGDREWVIVDEELEFLSQRELPRMALVEARLAREGLQLAAPGMPPLDLPAAGRGDALRVRVWNDTVDAIAQGEAADRWVSEFLQRPARIVRCAPGAQRISLRKYTGATEAPFRFADAFALLLASEASLADLNRRLAARGVAPVDMDRFRPNVVVDGVEAHDEDWVRDARIGSAVVQPVRPCVRCTVPSVDPQRGEQGHEPGDTLAAYRNDPRAGGVTFGVNAIVLRGAGTRIAVGDPVEFSFRF